LIKKLLGVSKFLLQIVTGRCPCNHFRAQDLFILTSVNSFVHLILSTTDSVTWYWYLWHFSYLTSVVVFSGCFVFHEYVHGVLFLRRKNLWRTRKMWCCHCAFN